MADLTPRMKELVQPYLAGIEPYDPNFTPTRINLSANENTYPVPAGVREAVDAALAATPLNRYPDPMSNDLRDELAAWHGVARENVCVGNGGDELLYNYLLAFGGAGRTLLNCPPCFSEYAFFASLCQTEVRDVWRDPATFELDQAAVLAAASECNLAIVTSPNNPTGCVLDAASLDAVACAARDHDLFVICDDVYESLVYASSYQRFSARHPELSDRVLVAGSFSKPWAMTGWRLGYAAGPAPLIKVMTKIHQSCIMSAPTTSQYAAIEAMRNGDVDIEKMRDEYDGRRRYLVEGLRRIGLPCFEPKGAFYVFPDIRGTGLTSDEFCERFLMEEKVAVISGSAFGPGGEGFIR